MRLNKYLADQGIASRRKADELISLGLVKINGKTVTTLGVQVDPTKDKIELNNALLKAETKKLIYVKLNKPYGYECSTNPPAGVPSVYDLMPKSFNLFSIGRLDKDSEGLLLLTNDGRLAYKLTHPTFQKSKEYEVTVDQNISDLALARLAGGVKILDRKTAPAVVTRISQRKFSIILTEGLNRQIRRMCRKLGLRVHKLKRIRIEEIHLGSLQTGHFTHLSGHELEFVQRLVSATVVPSYK